jgi:hypothetical protein
MCSVIDDELVAVGAILCEDGEFEILCRNSESTIVKVCLDSQSSVTFELKENYPINIPNISISSKKFPREKTEEIRQELETFASTLLGGPMLLEIVYFAKDKLEDCGESSSIDENETKINKHDIEILVVKLDHMRNRKSYVKILKRWTEELSLKACLVHCDPSGIFLVIQGSFKSVAKLLQRWKCENVDVDSSGKPCKEKLLQVLYRGQKGRLPEQENHFRVLETSNIDQLFKQSGLEQLL